uniref:Uncharacterized protein LOC101509069 n=1 Tax=Cicer arietinum TaxID=3827 RepID=A0A1S3E3V1_CICAR|nr:uncharacterized protein LOC101509069 [Cicer arietinum]
MIVTILRDFEEFYSYFDIEVNDNDSFLNVKQKIQKHRGIPISKQTLFFNGQILQDEDIVVQSALVNHSCITLEVAPPNAITLQLKLPFSSNVFPLEMKPDDTVLQLKDKVFVFSESWWRSVVEVKTGLLRTELNLTTASDTNYPLLDNFLSLKESGISNDSVIYGVIDITILQQGDGDGEKLMVTVIPTSKKGRVKINVEVKGCDNVGELRKRLDEFDNRVLLLPEDRNYLFVYNENLMSEFQSFNWHNVKDGDDIDLFDHMNLTFLIERQKCVTIEVGFFDSFLEVKEKIEKYESVLVSKQKFMFNGKLLNDKDTVIKSNLTQNSLILVKVVYNKKIPRFNLRVRFPGYCSLAYGVQVYLDETVFQLKKRIHNKFNFIRMNDMFLLFSTYAGNQVLDHQSLHQLRVIRNSYVYVFIKKQKKAPARVQVSPAFRGWGRPMLNLKVVPLANRGRGTIVKVRIASNAKVSELKKAMEYRKSNVLPKRCYLFIHKQYVMWEDESFEWHEVNDGDTIDLFGHVQED